MSRAAMAASFVKSRSRAINKCVSISYLERLPAGCKLAAACERPTVVIPIHNREHVATKPTDTARSTVDQSPQAKIGQGAGVYGEWLEPVHTTKTFFNHTKFCMQRDNASIVLSIRHRAQSIAG